MNDSQKSLIERLRGHYRIPITDDLGAAGGEEPDNPKEFVRNFPTVPIQLEAANMIEELLEENKQMKAHIKLRDGDEG